MTDEKLAAAHKLFDLINKTKNEIAIWENEKLFWSVNWSKGHSYSKIEFGENEFKVFRILTIERLRNELATLEKEFSEL